MSFFAKSVQRYEKKMTFANKIERKMLLCIKRCIYLPKWQSKRVWYILWSIHCEIGIQVFRYNGSPTFRYHGITVSRYPEKRKMNNN